jgi:hypothetical protein
MLPVATYLFYHITATKNPVQSSIHMRLTISDSLNATTAGVTRSPESFAITSNLESYTKYNNNSIRFNYYLYIKTTSFHQEDTVVDLLNVELKLVRLF